MNKQIKLYSTLAEYIYRIIKQYHPDQIDSVYRVLGGADHDKLLFKAKKGIIISDGKGRVYSKRLNILNKDRE